MQDLLAIGGDNSNSTAAILNIMPAIFVIDGISLSVFTCHVIVAVATAISNSSSSDNCNSVVSK